MFSCLLRANRGGAVEAQAVVARYMMPADRVSTTPAGFIRPITGFLMMRLSRWPLHVPWIVWSRALYALAGACRLPMPWRQLRMRTTAHEAGRTRQQLP